MRIPTLWIVAATAVLAAAAAAQDEDATPESLSRQMKTSIMFYERGDDLRAMDGFMDILVKGDASERLMANEYLNRISQRMSSGRPDFAPVPAAPASQMEPVGSSNAPAPAAPAAARPAAVPAAPAPAAVQPRPPARVETAATRTDKALMKKEIQAKLRYLRETSLKALKAREGVRVVMLENGNPLAIAIPSALLYSSGIIFDKGADKILEALIGLIYSQGSAQVELLAENAAIGDAKVQDLRRCMGVSAQLFSAGIATPRIKVNLLNSQVEIPKTLQDFKGIIIVFVYDRPTNLAAPSALGEESGPPVTLGVYPPLVRPEKDEGSVIEFSVSEPSAGLVSWKFQLMQPAADGSEPALLQEIAGGGPVFHQIYWNGRRNYFGAPLPAGRYECILAATDAKNRTHTLHRWIELRGESRPQAAAPKPEAPAKAEPAPIKENPPRLAAVEILAPAKGTRHAPRRRKTAKLAAKTLPRQAQAAPPAEPEARPPSEEDAAAVSAPPAGKAKKAAPGFFEIAFKSDAFELSKDGEKNLAQAAQAAADAPGQDLHLTGFAEASEPEKLAEKRAMMIGGLLVNKYPVDRNRIYIQAADRSGGRKVEIRFSPREKK